jgi:4-hydroxy-2-oxoglutarate aldolase
MKLAGVFAPIPTPIDDADRVDLARLGVALGRWLASPITGFVVLGSNGEAVLLDEDESDRVVAAARELVPRDRPLIVGAGRESTRATTRAVKRAADLGADLVIVRTPGFFKAQMTASVFVRHYTAIADASPVPVLLYNFSALTGVNLPLAAVTALAAHPNIVGMKESSGDIPQISELIGGAPPHFSVFAGSSTTFYAALCAGAAGGILALACVAPDACKRLYDLTVQHRHDEARLLQEQLAPLGRLVGSVHGVPGLKAALKLVGCDVGVPRLPLVPMADAGIEALRAALDKLHEVAA